MAHEIQGTRPGGARRRPRTRPAGDLWTGGPGAGAVHDPDPPERATHWSTRRLAKAVWVSPDTILRIWREGKFTPHRTETFKFSADP